jgi:hypothetical protein
MRLQPPLDPTRACRAAMSRVPQANEFVDGEMAARRRHRRSEEDCAERPGVSSRHVGDVSSKRQISEIEGTPSLRTLTIRSNSRMPVPHLELLDSPSPEARGHLRT